MWKKKPSAMWKLLGIALIVSLSGCAAAYHDYPGCCIPYVYCPPPPLPYAAYEGCHCPTPGVSLYLQQHGTPTTAIPDSDVPIETPTLSEQNGLVFPVWE